MRERRRHEGRRRAACLGRAAGLLALLLLAAACGGELGVATGPRSGGPIGTGGGTSADQQLLGRWARTVYWEDGYGGWNTSETTWDFTPDSVAARVNVARNTTFNTYSSTVSTARWHTEGTQLVIRYVSPDTGTVRFGYRVERRADADYLWLDEIPFVRVTR